MSMKHIRYSSRTINNNPPNHPTACNAQPTVEARLGSSFDGRIWYVVMSEPRREIVGLSSLTAGGYRAWLPLCTVTVRHAGRVVQKRAPLFPGYLFVGRDEGQAFAPILTAIGIASVVKAGPYPLVVRQATLDQVAAVVAAYERALRAPKGEAPPPFHAGQKLRVVEGPFTGLDGICTMAAHERTAVLLRFLGGETRAVLPSHILRVAD